MWQKALFVLTIGSTVGSVVLANSAEQNSVKLQSLAEFQQHQQRLTQQREHFLQLEALLQSAEKQGRVSETLLKRVEAVQDSDYPLFEDLQWQLLKAKLTTEEAKNPARLKSWIDAFSQQFPHTARRNRLEQRLFPAYYHTQQFSELVEYAKTVQPDTRHQCLLFSAKFQLLAEQAVSSATKFANSDEMATLLAAFETFWLKQAELASECNGIEGYWQDQGFKTPEKIQQKARYLFQQNAKTALANLSSNAPEALADWLTQLQSLLQSPAHLQYFAENQPLDPNNKAVLLHAFPALINTLSEKMSKPDYTPYQKWAERWQLSLTEQVAWKTRFIQRLFDHPDADFQQWRDAQIAELKVDSLTERRIRMAIWQKTDLRPWLALLSASAKQKAEWQYWLAKTAPTQAKKIWTQLAKQRGFYPMLAAHQLGQPYQIRLPAFTPMTDLQKNAWNRPLARVAELRLLQRFDTAKVAWGELLQAVSFTEKIALADYAIQQNWFDLAVEATIQAKAWDYLPLRFPPVYADWFAANLRGSTVSPSFAMAIARQESAWNVQARSSANAMGLMQMLPTTAQATAQHNQLPYQQARDLWQPYHNILLGTAHLMELNEKYPNNRILIAAAYNAGASRVERWLARAGGNLEMDEFIASIPFYETRGYVQNVLTYDFYYQWLYGKAVSMFSLEEQGRY